MFVQHSIFIFIIGLAFTEGVYHSKRTVRDDLFESIETDQAYLIVHNMIASECITLLGNKIQCEECDLAPMITVDSNQSYTLTIDTKYAYDLEVQSSSKISSSCRFQSYKFDENGTYLLQIVSSPSSLTYDCSITQTGDLSKYMTPAIVGIVVFLLYVLVVQIIQRFSNQRCLNCSLSISPQQRLINDDHDSIASGPRENPQRILTESYQDTNLGISRSLRSPVSSLTSLLNTMTRSRGVSSKRLHGLDTFPGFALMIMIFVNYGGGGYWFFDHSTWNGLTLADLVFPWFTWMMGISIVLSQRSLRLKNVSKLSILWKICRRTMILFVLGLSGEDDLPKLANLRILGVLQRLALSYFFTAIIVLLLDKTESAPNPPGSVTEQSLSKELYKSVFQYWMEWLLVMLIVLIWLLLTFLLPVPGCPTGYLGPGGNHEHGKYRNCTGGAAGYIDRLVLGSSHLYGEPTCKDIYDTRIPYDPEGILGNLTGILLCYLGVQAGHIFAHSSRVGRVCLQWIVWGLICGAFGLGLSNGGQSDSLIPINKNMWSLTFVLVLSSLAFFNLTILYLVVDVYRVFTGAPFLWLGMNSIAIYICHERFGTSFPVQFDIGNTHAALLAMHLYGSIFWSLVAGVMYDKKVFIAI